MQAEGLGFESPSLHQEKPRRVRGFLFADFRPAGARDQPLSCIRWSAERTSPPKMQNETMKRLLALVIFGLNSTGGALRTFDGLTFCKTEVVDLNGERSPDLVEYLERDYPFALMVPTSTALECMIVAPKGAYTEHVKMVIEFSSSPALNGHTSLLSTVKIVGISTGLHYYARSGHLVASEQPAMVMKGFEHLGAALLNPLKNRIKL